MKYEADKGYIIPATEQYIQCAETLAKAYAIGIHM